MSDMTISTMVRAALEERLDAYLDGLLSPSETRETERMLVRPEVAEVLAEAIAFREVLATAPPLEAPDGLDDRIIKELGLEPQVSPRRQRRVTRLGRAPVPADASAGRGPRTTRPPRGMLSRLGAMQFAFGPLFLLGWGQEDELEKMRRKREKKARKEMKRAEKEARRAERGPSEPSWLRRKFTESVKRRAASLFQRRAA